MTAVRGQRASARPHLPARSRPAGSRALAPAHPRPLCRRQGNLPRVRGQRYHIPRASAASGSISQHAGGRRSHSPSPPLVPGHGTIFPCVRGRRGSLPAPSAFAANVTHPLRTSVASRALSPHARGRRGHLVARSRPAGPSPRVSAAKKGLVRGTIILPCFQFVSGWWTRPARRSERH